MVNSGGWIAGDSVFFSLFSKSFCHSCILYTCICVHVCTCFKHTLPPPWNTIKPPRVSSRENVGIEFIILMEMLPLI